MKATLQLEDVVEQLRLSCPWNARQTATELVPALEAEVAELRHAMSTGLDTAIAEELGDVLFNLVSLAAYYRELGLFDLRDVDAAAARKMIARHPYVFADQPDPGPELADEQWHNIKAAERAARRASRLGVLIGCEIYGMGDVDFHRDQWLEEAARRLALPAGIAPDGAAHLLRYLELPLAERDTRQFIVTGTDGGHLVVHIGATRRQGLIHGFAPFDVDSVELRRQLHELFMPSHVEMTLVERPRHGSLLSERG